jgi:hypothetical protein
MANSCDTSVAAGSLSSQAWSLPENVRWGAEFLSAQGRDLGQYRVDAQIDGCLMTWEYLVHLRERAFILPILALSDAEQLQNVDAAAVFISCNRSALRGSC